ncbi:MAG: SusC/RagA family TonB-linked outer membrane protein, partial [Daejeonella sp.]
EKSGMKLGVLADGSIKGKVSDSKGITLPGVTVKLEGGSPQTTSTDAQGNYSFPNVAPGNYTLVFTYLGFTRVTRAVSLREGQQSSIDVSLVEESGSLDEVVVIGYGSVKKRDVTGSVGSVSAEELTAYPVADAVMGLQGKTAGVQVLQNSGAPGANISVRIRGGNSLLGNNEPLYVVDGFALSGNPNAINPNDIESIEVLKDASATAIYGSRGANGVVLITTKIGKSGKSQVTFDSYYAVQEVGKTLDLMTARQFAELANERTANDGVPAYFTQSQINSFGQGTDWQDALFRKAPMQNYSINAMGGNASTRYSVSGNFLSQDGIVRGSNLKRGSVKANIDQKISDKIRLSYNTTFTNTDLSQLRSDNGAKGNSVISGISVAPPTVAPMDADGNYNDTKPYSFSPNALINPLALALALKQATNQKYILGGTAITYKPVNNLVFRSSLGIENTSSRRDSYSPTILDGTPTGQANISSVDAMNFLNENTLTYTKRINDLHDISVLGGLTYQQNTFKNFGTGNISGFSTDQLGTNNLESGSVPGTPQSGASKWVLFSYLSRVNYSYKDTYLLTGSMRADGSSRFGEGNKWGYFPSAAFAWRAINEDFAKKLDFLSDLKFRLSWGITGSTALSPYQTLNTLNSYQTVFNNQLYIGYAPSQSSLANPNLKWETTVQSDAGADIGFFQNRLSLTFDYYRKDTKDLLAEVPLPTSSGYSNTIKNIGRIRNSGIELGLNTIILDNDAFRWDMNVNFSKNKNKVIELAGGSDVFGESIPQPLQVAVNLVRVGQPVGVFYGYREDGLDAKGAIKYHDLNKDGVINLNDKSIIGDPNPDFIYNLGSRMSYKNFDLNFSFQGKQGGDIFNANLSATANSFYFGENQIKEVYYNHWTPANPNPNAKYPKISAGAKFLESDRYIEDGSFLRFKNIQLAYNVPVSKTGIKVLKNLQMYVSAQNFMTLTNYSWYDPEVSTRGGSNSISIGIDNTAYPNAKTYTFGIRAGL